MPVCLKKQTLSFTGIYTRLLLIPFCQKEKKGFYVIESGSGDIHQMVFIPIIFLRKVFSVWYKCVCVQKAEHSLTSPCSNSSKSYGYVSNSFDLTALKRQRTVCEKVIFKHSRDSKFSVGLDFDWVILTHNYALIKTLASWLWLDV